MHDEEKTKETILLVTALQAFGIALDDNLSEEQKHKKLNELFRKSDKLLKESK